MDAVILNRFYGKEHAAAYPVKETSIMFHPTRLYFAGPMGKRIFLDAVDRQLEAMKKDGSSAYFEVLRRWLTRDTPAPYPSWLVYLALGLVAVSALTVTGNFILKWQVNRKTEELRKSEQNYREVFNGTNEAIIIHDEETGRIVDVNQTMLDLFGHESREDVLKLTLADISANRDQYTAEEAKRWMEKAAKEGTQLVPWCCRRGDGSEFYTEVGLTKTEIGGEGRVLAAVRDVTQRKAAEEALRESERKFRTLTETLTAFVVLVQDEKIVYVNPAAETMLGFSPDHFIGMKFDEPFHPVDREAIRKRREERRTGFMGRNRYDSRLKHADGSYRWIDFSTFVTEFDGVPSILVTGFDVTERKKAEEALAKSEKRWREMYTQTPVMLMGVDEDGRISEVSDYWCKTLGYDREDFIGKHGMSMTPPEVDKILEKFWERSIAEAAVAEGGLPPKFERIMHGLGAMFGDAMDEDCDVPPVIYTQDSGPALLKASEVFFEKAMTGDDLSEFVRNAPVSLRKKNGEIIDVLMTNIFEIDDDGDIQGMLYVAVDVTEERRALEALQKSEGRWRDLYVKSPVMMMAEGPDGRIREVSDTFCKALGYDASDFIGRHPHELMPRDHAVAVAESWKETLDQMGEEARAFALAHHGLAEMMQLLDEGDESEDADRLVIYDTESGGEFLEALKGFQKGIIDGQPPKEFPRNIPLRLVKRDGGTIDVLQTMILEVDDTGKLQGQLYVAVDVTEEKRAIDALRKSEERFRKLYGKTPVMAVALDQEGTIKEISNYWCEVLGYEIDEVIGKNGLRFFSEESRASILERRAKTRAGEEIPEVVKNVPVQMVHKEGGRIDVLLTYIPEMSDSGENVGMLCIAVDVTEEKRANEALRENEERWRKMYTEAPVMMCAVDKLGRIQEVSNAWCETLGYTRNEIIGMHRFAFFPREVLEETFEAWRGYIARAMNKGTLDPNLEAFMENVCKLDVASAACMDSPEAWLSAIGREGAEFEGPSMIAEESGQQIREVWENFLEKLEQGEGMPESIRNFPLKLKKRNGETIDVLMTKILVKEESGEIGGAFVVAVDVTEEKQLQAQLLHQDKIAAVGMLAAGVAHEIGNPLLAISMAAQSLGRKSEDPYVGKKVDLISGHIDRISKIVQQMSDLARPPSDEKGRCDVNAVIQKALDIVRYDKRAKQSDIRTDLARDLPPVTAVEDHLVQVFINLALNAVDALGANPEGRPRNLNVTTEPFGMDGRKGVRISFEDTGPGIGAEDIGKVFQPFYTTKEVGKGTGLGLAVSYRIIQDHGGRITVDTKAGEGTRFTIELPVQELK
ncbi:MAG: PAS domain-containing protein [Planctomycetota bacterium]